MSPLLCRVVFLTLVKSSLPTRAIWHSEAAEGGQQTTWGGSLRGRVLPSLTSLSGVSERLPAVGV